MILRSFVSKFQGPFCTLCRSLTSSTSLRLGSCSFIVSVGLCASENPKKFELSSPEKLTHHFLLRQASTLTANSASQLLNQTVTALIDTAEDYKNALNNLMTIIEECQSNLGNEILQQEAADLIIEYRSKVNSFKSDFVELESLLEYVEKVVTSTSETTFLVGAEYSSVALSEHLHAAKQAVLKVKKSIENLEHDYLKAQQFFIESSTKFDEKNKT